MTRAEMLAELERLDRELSTQDNRLTHPPIFMVQEKRRLIGIDPSYDVSIVWVQSDYEVTAESDPEEFERLEGPYRERGEEDGDWTRTGYVEQWHNVQPFLTESGAKAYLKVNGHNLRETRIYVESGYRNHEWEALRAMLSGPLLEAFSRVQTLEVELAVERDCHRVASDTRAELAEEREARAQAVSAWSGRYARENERADNIQALWLAEKEAHAKTDEERGKQGRHACDLFDEVQRQKRELIAEKGARRIEGFVVATAERLVDQFRREGRLTNYAITKELGDDVDQLREKRRSTPPAPEPSLPDRSSTREYLAALAQQCATGMSLPGGIVAAVIVTDKSGAWLGVGATCDKAYMNALVWAAAHGEDRRDHIQVKQDGADG